MKATRTTDALGAAIQAVMIVGIGIAGTFVTTGAEVTCGMWWFWLVSWTWFFVKNFGKLRRRTLQKRGLRS